ncbi:hypothetical protein LIER_39331 [Lithospermum erythrorhizon]|uniref:Uncharacterized protein n=1 Tax=Lithospermum erythrorhizon TaxID=34254 RepID=A0AAV3QD47_LITER
MGRIMLNEHNSPKYFWIHAVDTECHVLNKVFLRPLVNKTPNELWHGKTPNILYFKVFGCKCYVLNTKDKLGKFDAKSNEGYGRRVANGIGFGLFGNFGKSSHLYRGKGLATSNDSLPQPTHSNKLVSKRGKQGKEGKHNILDGYYFHPMELEDTIFWSFVKGQGFSAYVVKKFPDKWPPFIDVSLDLNNHSEFPPNEDRDHTISEFQLFDGEDIFGTNCIGRDIIPRGTQYMRPPKTILSLLYNFKNRLPINLPVLIESHMNYSMFNAKATTLPYGEGSSVEARRYLDHSDSDPEADEKQTVSETSVRAEDYGFHHPSSGDGDGGMSLFPGGVP